MGRPKGKQTAAERRAQITLANHPKWLTYADIQVLLKEWQGKGYGHKVWDEWVATKRIPAYSDPMSSHLRYQWEEVQAALEANRTKVGNRKQT